MKITVPTAPCTCAFSFAALAFLLGFGSLHAADLTWSVPNSNYWEYSALWGGTRPTAADTVTVINPGNGADNFLIVAPPSGGDPSWNGTGFYGGLTMSSAFAQRVNLVVYSNLVGFGDSIIGTRAGVTVSSGTWANLGGVTLAGIQSTLTVSNNGVVSSNLAEVGKGAGASSTVSILSGGRWFNDSDFRLGTDGGTAVLQVDSGGTLDLDGSLVLGNGSSTSGGTVGLLSTSGTQGVLSAYSVVKSVGSGTLIFNGGILRAVRNEANFVTGFAPGGLGISDNGAFIDSAGFNIGITSGFVGQGGLAKQGLGTLTLTGSNSYGGNTVIQSGTLAVSGTGVIDSSSAIMAVGANTGENGSLLIGTGGRVTVASAAVGTSSSSQGNVTVAGGTLSMSGAMSVGTTGTGSFALSGGAATNGNAFFGSSTGTGSATVSGGSWNTSDLTFGRGSLVVTGGTVSTAGNSFLGGYASSASVATVSGGSWDTAGYLIVGFAGSGTLQVNGGFVAARTGLIVGYASPATGVVTLSSGTLATAFVLDQNGGVGRVNLNGGTLRALANQGNFFTGFGSGDVTVGGSAAIDTNGFAVGITNGLSGTGALIKTGAGTLTLSGSNAYTGQTEVEGGTLLVTGDSSSSSRILVDAGASFGGTGAVNDVRVSALGTLTPGTLGSTGLLVIEGGLVMELNSMLRLEFSGTGAGAFDQLAVGGSFSATGANLYLDVNYAAQLGDSFQVFTGGTPASGAFTITSDLGGGLYWDASQLSSAGRLTVIPEPSTLSLAAFGVGALAYGLRRQTRSRRA